MKRPIASLHINKYKIREDGTSPVSVLVYYNRDRRKFPVGVSMTPSDFTLITDRIRSGKAIKKTERRLMELNEIIKPAVNLLKLTNQKIDELKIFTFDLLDQALNDTAPIDTLRS